MAAPAGDALALVRSGVVPAAPSPSTEHLALVAAPEIPRDERRGHKRDGVSWKLPCSVALVRTLPTHSVQLTLRIPTVTVLVAAVLFFFARAHLRPSCQATTPLEKLRLMRNPAPPFLLIIVPFLSLPSSQPAPPFPSCHSLHPNPLFF